MKILSVEISNILSLESAKLEFNDSGLVLVEGWNYDDGRANGAGKTAVFNALTFGLYDKLPRKITASEILRRGARSGWVKVVVQCGGATYTVTRHRPKNVSFLKDGQPIILTQDEWESILRLSYEQFIVSMYAAQNTSQRFLLLNDSDKKSFLLQLLNLDEFATCKEQTDQMVKDISASIDLDLAKLNASQAKLEAYSSMLVDETLIQQELSDLKLQIKQHSEAVSQYQQVAKPDFSKYAKLEDDIAEKLSYITGTKTRRSMLHDSYRKLQTRIKPFKGDTSCYACGSALDVTEARDAHQKEMDSLSQELADLKQQIDVCDEALQKENDILELNRKLREKKTKESAEYQTAVDQIREHQSLVKLKSNNVQNMVLKLENNHEILSKINSLHGVIEGLSKNIASNKRDLDLYKTLSAMYSATGAQAYVLDSVVESFNEYVACYVDLAWPNASYRLNSYRENAKGDLSAKFSEVLTMGGKQVSAGSLSGGELKALSLCADFAILDILEKHFGLAINPIVLDEPFNDLDAVGKEIVIDLLSKLANSRQIFVIEHASEAKAMFSKIIRVEKRNEISSVTVDL